jgi:hypothetical protein
MLSHPGASRFVLEVQVPYCTRAMFDYLGEELEQACSAEAAETMAGRAFERAVILSLTDVNALPVLGISCTAALQTNRERRGEDRAFIGIKSRKKQIVCAVKPVSGDRAEQEEWLSRELLKTIAGFVGDNAG